MMRRTKVTTTAGTPPRSPQPEEGPGSERLTSLAPAIVRVALPLLLSVLCAFAAVHSTRADGEVGLVVEEDGQVRMFCVAYQGDSISGDELLEAAGLPYEDLGTSAGSVLCSVEEVGCFNASSYNSCWCECQSGGSDCTYWAFFTRDHGAGWVYSARAFDRVNANDGDVQAWKWGEGGPSSAPKPSESLTFESVCGHAPRGGVAPPAATLQPTTAPTLTQPPGTLTAGPSASVIATDTPFTTPGTISASPGVSVTFSPLPTAVAPLPPATARDEDDGGSPAAFVAFGVVAVALVGAIGAAAYWRRRHGA
ncbi:MAG: hypothetical protein ACRDHY_02610 [Anaerolineales bacterium]